MSEKLETLIKQQGEEIAEIKEILRKLTEAKPKSAQQQQIENPAVLESIKDMLDLPQWPAAVDMALACDANSEQDKWDRAEGILDRIVSLHLEKLNFLDFGCGEGHVVIKSLDQLPSRAVGYDIKESPKWKNSEKCLFTTDWTAVQENGPYNAVLLCDVLDHIMGDDSEVVNSLREIRSVMAPNAKVFVRCHPWVSRHGTHLYQKVNKAYIHLIFTEDELKQMNLVGLPTRQLPNPASAYDSWFQTAGFKRHQKEHITKKEIERFFTTTTNITQRIKRNCKSGAKFPQQLDIQFIDYVLT